MPKPGFDRSTGWWAIRYVDASGRRKKVPLQRHPGWNPGDRSPKKPPANVLAMARKYEDIAASARHGIDTAPAEPIPLAHLRDEYRAVWSVGKRPSTVANFDGAWTHFVAHCATANVTTAQGVTARVCRAYMAARLEAGAARGSVKTERAHLAATFAAAVSDGLLAANPWHGEAVPGKPRLERPDFWERDELARLIAACSRPLDRDMVIVGVNTGLRAQNLCDLAWSEVNLAAGFIEVPASKTKAGKPVRIPLNPDALGVLTRRKAEIPGPWVFPVPGADGRLTLTRGAFARRMILARVRAGLPSKRQPAHILRHTFATHAARVVPLPILQQWLGHASITMTMRYVHVSEAESARCMAGFSLGIIASPGTPDPTASGAS